MRVLVCGFYKRFNKNNSKNLHPNEKRLIFVSMKSENNITSLAQYNAIFTMAWWWTTSLRWRE